MVKCRSSVEAGLQVCWRQTARQGFNYWHFSAAPDPFPYIFSLRLIEFVRNIWLIFFCFSETLKINGVFVFWKFESGWVCIFESSRVVGSVFLKVWKWRWVCGSRFWGFCCCSAACWQAGRRRVKSSARNKAACTQLYKIYKNLMEKYKIQIRNYRISRKRAIGTKLCVAQLHRCCCL